MPQGDLATEKYCLFLRDGLPDPSETNSLEQIDAGLVALVHCGYPRLMLGPARIRVS